MAEQLGASPAETGEYTHAQVLTILSGLLLGMFLGALDQNIVSTSIRTIADDLQGLSVQAWATTAYLITATVTTPIYGKLGDLYGRKRLFLFSISVFVLGSALCACAASMYQLAAYRGVQGIGAGGLFTLAMAIIGDLVSPRQRARYTGWFIVMFGTSSVLGPVVGGLFSGQEQLLGVAGWRWVFLVNVPIGVAALLVVLRTLRLPPTRPAERPRIDWWGATALLVGLVPLLTVAEQGREWGWTSGRVVTAYVVGGLGLVAFVLIERAMRDAALIPLSIFRIRAASVSIAAVLVLNTALLGAVMVLPLYLQVVRGASPTESGLLMLPLIVGMMVASLVGGRVISRTAVIRPFPVIGSAVVAVAMLALSVNGADAALPGVLAEMLVLGVGLGSCMQPLLLIVQSAVPPASIGVATSSATFFQQIGGSLGVAVFLSLLFGTVGGNIADRVEVDSQSAAWQSVAAGADPGSVDGQVVASLASPGAGVLETVLDDSSVIDRMDPVLARPFQVGFADSVDLVFLVAALVALLAFLVLLLMPDVSLRATSAQAAVRADRARAA